MNNAQQHTPGPWLHTDEANQRGMRYVRQSPEADGGAFEICRVEGWANGVGEANARLIATAPEMLDALVKILKETGPAKGDTGLVNTVANLASAAIAQATGRSASGEHK